MNELQKVAKEYLAAEHDAGPWHDYFYCDPTTGKLNDCIHMEQFMDRNHGANFEKIRNKPISELTFTEVCTYLTAIFRHNRTSEGTVTRFTEDGTIKRLLLRCLEVEPESEEGI